MGQGLDVLWSDENTAGVIHDFEGGSYSGTDYRQAGAKRFYKNDPKGFGRPDIRLAEDVRGGQQPLHICPLPQKAHTIADPQTRRLFLQASEILVFGRKPWTTDNPSNPTGN